VNSPWAETPWLERSEIAFQAEGLLRDFRRAHRGSRGVPVAVEAIIERHLGLRLVYDDLERLLGIPDVLGATWIQEKLVVIHERLVNGNEGRHAFTCAHEVGHWILHRDFFQAPVGSPRARAHREPVVVCRASNAGAPLEWQANHFAACLLMPEDAVSEAYHARFGHTPLVMHNRRSCFGPGAAVLDPALDTAKEIAGRVIDAGEFTNVSREAMRYRLQELGLLIDRT
jgi:Zn-dependent peptidase ImmA (M78 family)